MKKLFLSNHRFSFFYLLCIFFAISVLASCRKSSFDSANNDSRSAASELPLGTFDVNIKTEFQNTIYPSLIFGFAEVERQQNTTFPFFVMDYNASQSGRIRITVQESELNEETVITEYAVQGPNYFAPALKWKYEVLKRKSQPGLTSFTFICADENGKEIGRKNIRASYRAVNECVFGARLDGKLLPLFNLFASYVNEDNPIIDQFLQKVLQTTDLPQFADYQSGQESDVVRQVYAIFITLRKMGVSYSNITATSNRNPNIHSQYVRFTDEVLGNTQANCVDGTAFLCSVLQKIGIHSYMIFEPGHVYLGYATKRDKTSLEFLETTLIGGNMNTVKDDFIYASRIATQKFLNNAHHYTNNMTEVWNWYIITDIDEARHSIKPIGR